MRVKSTALVKYIKHQGVCIVFENYIPKVLLESTTLDNCQELLSPIPRSEGCDFFFFFFKQEPSVLARHVSDGRLVMINETVQ